MAKKPMPVPRNLGGAPGPRTPPRKPRRTGPKPLTVFAVVLLVLLLVCGCVAVLASTGPDGAHQSHLPVIGVTSNYMSYGPTDAIAPSVTGPERISQPRGDEGHAIATTTRDHRLSLPRAPRGGYPWSAG